MEEYRVLLIEQNRIMLERLSSVVRTTAGFRLVAREKSPEQALQQAGVFLPNLILLDIDWPENMDLVHDFVRAFPQAGLICLSAQWNAQLASAVVKAGAKGYLIKPFTGEELLTALKTFGSSGMGLISDVMTFFSPKGKSGKTTLIANLAMALAKKTKQSVGIIDADLQFGDLAVFFNLEPQSTIVEAIRDIHFLSPITLNAYFQPVNDQVRVLCGTKRPEFAENIKPKAFWDLVHMARSLFRYVLIDIPPAFSPVSAVAAEAADHVYLVTMMGGGFEIQHVKRALEIFQVWPDYEDRVKTIFTRVEPCDKNAELDLADLTGYPVSGILPNEYVLVSNAANNGRMAAELDPNSPLASRIEILAAAISAGGKKAVP